MKLSDLTRSGHWLTLLAAFLYFDYSFMIWTVLGPLGVQIGRWRSTWGTLAGARI